MKIIVLILGLSALLAGSCFREDRRAIPLEIPWGRDIELGQRHAYCHKVKAGGFSQVTVRQCGADVLLRVSDGDQSWEVDGPTLDQGIERVVFLPEKDTTYFIEVVGASRKVGYYDIVAEDRTTEPGDQRRLWAEQTRLQAYWLSTKGTPQAKRDAIAKYEAALPYYQGQLEIETEALIWKELGLQYQALEENQTALACYERSTMQYRELEDWIAVSYNLNQMGMIYWHLSAPELALDAWHRALPLMKQHRKRWYVNALQNIAMVHSQQQRYQIALDYYRKVLAEQDLLEWDWPELIPLIWMNMGQVYHWLGDLKKAREFYEKARERESLLGDKRAWLYRNLGIIAFDLGEQNSAMTYFQKALTLARKKDNLDAEASILNGLGSLLLEWEFYDEAIHSLHRAIALDRDKYKSNPLLSLGRRYYKRLVAAGDSGAREDYELAVFYLNEALAQGQKIEHPEIQANAWLWLGRTLEQGQRLGLTSTAAADPIDSFLCALEIVESQRLEVSDAEPRNSFFAKIQYYYEAPIQLLLSRSRDPESVKRALSLSERARARNLLEVLAKGTSSAHASLDIDLLDNRWALRHQIEELKGSNRDVKNITMITRLEQELKKLEEQIQAHAAEQISVADSPILDARGIQALLDTPDTVLLEYFLAESKSFLWMVTGEQIRLYELPGRATIERLADKIQANLGRKVDRKTARQRQRDLVALSKMLLGPVFPLLEYRRLVIVADVSLQAIPFSVLPLLDANGDPLSEEFQPYPAVLDAAEVVYLPSASVLAAMLEETDQRSTPPRQLAIFFDPVFDGAYPSLKGTRREAAAIFEQGVLHEGLSKIRYGTLANKTEVLEGHLSNYRWIHFATHGEIDTGDAGLSRLVLSQRDFLGRPIDGFVTLNDVVKLNLNADLVVLSACETALGKAYRGEGLMSLARGFMIAGGQRVLATQWRVTDDTTHELMATFYRHFLREKRSYAGSLREAQLTIRERWPDPYFWGGFIMIGNWQ